MKKDFIIHASGKCSSCGTECDHESFPTHTHGQMLEGMFYMVFSETKALSVTDQAKIINILADYYLENQEHYREFLTHKKEIHHFDADNMKVEAEVRLGYDKTFEAAYNISAPAVFILLSLI